MRDATPTDGHRVRDGILYSLGAYTAWGLFPLYLRLVRDVPPFEFLLHRVLWSVVLLFVILGVRRQWAWLGAALRSRAVLRSFAASALVLSVNWFVFIWSVHVGRVVDASLGYFINPLVSVALGAIFLHERLRRWQKAAVGLAALGVLWLIVEVGQFPWIGLALAVSFGSYGLLRKTAPLGALEGLAVETLLLLPIAVATFAWLAAHGQSRFVDGGVRTKLLVLGAGPVTTVPLLLFAAGTRRIPLSLVGFLQYVGPTLQLLSGVFIMGEPFPHAKLIGFALIWLGFVVASVEGVLGSRQSPKPLPAELRA